ncbi:MAG: ABC transporter permease subunit [Clostridia bacterium]
MLHFIHQKRILRNWDLYLLLIPVLAFYLLFHYGPMYGVQLAFKKFMPIKGIDGSPWVGLTHFIRFFNSPYFNRLLWNTLSLSLLQLAFGFPLPILLALMINEVSNVRYKKIVQNITYAPHFISTVVIVGLIRSFVNLDYGIVNTFIRALGGEGANYLIKPDWFRPLYVGTSVWQNAGWNSIIYIAALSGVDPQLHESAMIDGANHYQCVWHINMPSILPTIVIMLILNVGSIMNVGFEKAFLMQNDLNLRVSDIISTYSYRLGIQGAQYDFATAIGLFNSVINCILLVLVNTISRRVGETSLW